MDRFRVWLCVGASALFLASAPDVSAASGARAESGANPVTSIVSFNHRGKDGKTLTRTLQPGEAVAISSSDGAAAEPVVRVLAAEGSEPARVLVRLKGEPMAPFAARLRQSGLIAQQSLMADRHEAALHDKQEALLTDLRNAGALQATHARFVQLTNALSLSIDQQHLPALRQHPLVASVRPDNKVHATLSESVPRVGAPSLWSRTDAQGNTVTGKGISVAIIDTGIDYRHPDLGGCLGSGCKVVGGRNFVYGEDASDPLDRHGHGTHVAGIVAANGSARGVAPDATLYAAKALDDEGGGYESWIISALEWAANPDGDYATDDQVDVINMSLGGTGLPDSPLSEAANNAVLRGIAVAVAAGNEGPGTGSIGSPGNAEQVITVAASDRSDRIADFSSRGPMDGYAYVKPEIAAPGVSIRSTIPDGGYASYSGTSMASPHVAGGLALLRQLRPDLDPAALKSMLVAGAKRLDADLFSQGAGRLDLVAASATRVLAYPALVSFGLADLDQSVWRSERIVRLHNISNDIVTTALARSASRPLPAGASMTVQPEAPQSLAPGARTDVRVALSVDNAQVPPPTTSAMQYESALTSSAADAPLTVPVVFHKASSLKLSWNDSERGRTARFTVFSDDGRFSRTINVMHGEATQLLLKPGRYNVWVMADTEEGYAWIVREGIDVATSRSVAVDLAEAIHSVVFGPIYAPSGQNVTESLDKASATVSIQHPQSGMADMALVYGLGSPFRFSTLPDRIKVSVSTLYYEPDAPESDWVSYAVETGPLAGVRGDVRLSLDAREAGKLQFEVADPEVLAKDRLLLLPWQWRFGQIGEYRDAFGTASGWSREYKSSEPLRATIYSNVVAPVDHVSSVSVSVIEYSPDDRFWTDLVDTGQIGFPKKGGFAKLGSITGAPYAEAFRVDDGRYQVRFGGGYFGSQVVSWGEYDEFIAMENYDYQELTPVGPDLKGAMGTLFPKASLPYELACDDGEQRQSGVVDKHEAIPVPEACVQQVIDLQLAIDVDVLRQQTASTIDVRLVPAPLHHYPPPDLRELRLMSDGKPSSVLDGASAEISLGWSAYAALRERSLEYRLDGQDAWTTLPLESRGDRDVASLPMPEVARVGSLRVTAVDANGSRQQQTLNSMFVIGPGSRELVRIPQVVRFLTTPILGVGQTVDVQIVGGGSGNPVELRSFSGRTCTVSGSRVTGASEGTCKLRASQAGNDDYQAAADVDISFAITKPKQFQQIEFESLLGVEVGQTRLLFAAGGQSGNSVGFSVSPASICRIEGQQVRGHAIGDCEVVASQAGNDEFHPAPPVTRKLAVYQSSGERLPADDVYAVASNSTTQIPASIGVLANDPMLAGKKRVLSFDQPTHGSVSMQSNGAFTYSPGSTHAGADRFAYWACDSGGCAEASVFLNLASPLSAGDQYLWLVPPASNDRQQGFIRLSNRADASGTVTVWGIDRNGRRSTGAISLALGPKQSTHFNSQDLERGNGAKGLSGSLGAGNGNWMLVVRSELDLDALAYIRTPDGFVTSMHDRVEGNGVDWVVPMFNPASNPNQVSRLRLVNSTLAPVDVQITGLDDAGQPGQSTITMTLPPLASREYDAIDLEQGNADKGLIGSLGEGEGKWRLSVSATDRITVQSLLADPMGYLTNLSTFSTSEAGDERVLWMVTPAEETQQQGFLRLTNLSSRSGTLTIWGVDDRGQRSAGTATLTLGAKETKHLNSQDLEYGNPDKGLAGSLGNGEGDWRIFLSTDLSLLPMGLIRTPNGFVTTMHDLVQETSRNWRAPMFNPASNPNQVSVLRVINPGNASVTVNITGVDDAGRPGAGGSASFTLAPKAAVEFTAQELEQGSAGRGLVGSLGDGEGKWSLQVSANAGIKVISMLRDPNGYLTNLSNETKGGAAQLDP